MLNLQASWGQGVGEALEVSACDGCGEPMTFPDYQSHACPAYKTSIHKNPLSHKMAKSVWKSPKGKIIARGRCLTPEDIAMAKSKLPKDPKPGFRISGLGGKIVIAVVLVAVALLVVYG